MSTNYTKVRRGCFIGAFTVLSKLLRQQESDYVTKYFINKVENNFLLQNWNSLPSVAHPFEHIIYIYVSDSLNTYINYSRYTKTIAQKTIILLNYIILCSHFDLTLKVLRDKCVYESSYF